MDRHAQLLFMPQTYRAVIEHLYRGDISEHAGVFLCGWQTRGESVVLTVREFIPARDGIDYVLSPEGHGRLQALFIDDALTRAKAQNLAYLAIHNHLSDDWVRFSSVDLASHEYGYPTLRSLNAGLPVGAAVFGSHSVEVDLWMPDQRRLSLKSARIVGKAVQHLYAGPQHAPVAAYQEQFDRQLPFLRGAQGLIHDTAIGIVGLGGLGSQLLEPLVRLGFSKFVLIDPDHLELSNYSRVHGAVRDDLPRDGKLGVAKVEIAKRLLLSINPDAEVEAIVGDVARGATSVRLRHCDFIFLAADTAEARLTCNAITQQFFIPMVQVGTKVHIEQKGEERVLRGVFGAVRHVRPGSGCLWCNGLIDRAALANATKSQEQRERERYGVQAPSPAVVTFNAEVAARAMNEFLSSYIAPHAKPQHGSGDYVLLDLMSGEREGVEPTASPDCPFCAASNPSSLLGKSATVATPVIAS